MYYLSFIYLWIIFYLSRRNGEKYEKFAFLPFILIPFLRYGVGSDYFSYQYLYDYLPVDSLNNALRAFENLEPGFVLIMYIGRLLRINFHIYFGIISTVISFILYKALKNQKEPVLSLILYYSLFYLAWNLNAIRQGIVLLLFTSYYMNNKNKNILFTLFLIIILSFIHISALILIPLVILNKLKFKPNQLLIFAFLGILFSKLPFQSLIEPFKDYQYIGKVASYLDTLNPNFLDFPSIMRLVLFGLGFYLYNIVYDDSSFKAEGEIIQFYLLGLSLYFYAKPIEVLASRTSIYGYFFIIYILPFTYTFFNNFRKKLGVIALSFIFLFSSLGIYKELHAAAEQSGYLKKPLLLNNVLIFNYNGDDFYNTFNIIYNIKENTKDDLAKFYNNKDLKPVFVQDEQYIAVKFPDSKGYGIIDTQGNVVEIPSYDERPKIYGKYVQDKGGLLQVKDLTYRLIGTNNQMWTSKIIDQIVEQEEKKLINTTQNFPKTILSFDEIDQESFKHFFKTEANGRMEHVAFTIPFEYEIIQTHLRKEPLAMITSIKGTPYESKIYLNVSPYEGTDILVAETHQYYEYINSTGKTIWLEPK